MWKFIKEFFRCFSFLHFYDKKKKLFRAFPFLLLATKQICTWHYVFKVNFLFGVSFNTLSVVVFVLNAVQIFPFSFSSFFFYDLFTTKGKLIKITLPKRVKAKWKQFQWHKKKVVRIFIVCEWQKKILRWFFFLP